MLQAIANGPYAGSPENHYANEVSCLDSWTGVTIKVPIGGLTPYPDADESQPYYAPSVIMSPIALLTLGGGEATKTSVDIRGEYDLAHQRMNVADIDAGGGVVDGQYGQGMMNSGAQAKLVPNYTAVNHAKEFWAD